MRYRHNPLEIEWGYRRFPNTVKAVWGARAILEDWGADLLWDRQSMASEPTPEGAEEKARLVEALDGKPKGTGVLKLVQNEIKRLLKVGLLYKTPRRDEIERKIEHQPEGIRPDISAFYRDQANEFILADKDGIVIAGNTQASHGYLYMVGFVKPSGFKIAMSCEKCHQNSVTFESAVCGVCSKRICKKCQSEACGDCAKIICKSCLSKLECAACHEWVCGSEECQDKTGTCSVCENLLCSNCVENAVEICQECEEVECAVCHKVLYSGSSADKLCENCEAPMHPKCYRSAGGLCEACSEEQEQLEDEESEESESEE